MIFVNEVGFNLTMRTKTVRSQISKPAVHVIPALQTRNMSFCCAMVMRGIISFSAQKEAFKTPTFVDFIDNENCSGYFRNIHKFLPLYIGKKEIIYGN